MYKRAQMRESHYVKLRYNEGAETDPAVEMWVASVIYYVLLRDDGVEEDEERAPTLRLAFCKLYSCDVKEEGFVYAVRDMAANPDKKFFAVEVDTIATKLMRASCEPENGRQPCYFFQYKTFSQMPADDGVGTMDA